MALLSGGDGGRSRYRIEGLGRMAELFGRLFLGTTTKAMAKDLEALRAHLEGS